MTSVPVALSREQDIRVRRYVLSMLVRTLCVLGVVVVPGWWRWLLLAGAVFLPYLAVVVANAPRARARAADVDVVLPAGAASVRSLPWRGSVGPGGTV